ncbi:MAG: hypothetical protein LUD12_08660 [Lachnospiraceae bacterium]|nr:hypothetical protein [Lachnospiraceae bacterium]
MESGDKICALKNLPYVLFVNGHMYYVLNEELGSLDIGLIVVADNSRISGQFLIGYCEVDGSNGISFSCWNSRVKRPDNYQIGFLNLTNDMKQINVERFLAEKSFATVLMTGGAIPDYLIGSGYLIKLDEKDNNLVRSTVFSEVIQKLQIYMKENIGEICNMLQKFQTSRVMTEYSGEQEMKLFYSRIMAVGKILQMFIRQTMTEETAEQFFKEYHQEWANRIASIPKLADSRDTVRRFSKAMSDYLLKHPEIQTGRSELVEADLMIAADNGCAILYDDEFIYCTEEQFMDISTPLRITMSSAMLKKQCAESGLIKKDAEGYSPKKQYTNAYGIPVRKHFVWIYKDILLNEADAFLWEVFGDNHLGESRSSYVYGKEHSDCSTKFYVGLNDCEQSVTISKNSPNYSVLITGISGSGKSYAIDGIEHQIVQNGGTVLEIDINGNRQSEQEDIYHIIPVNKNGLSEAFIVASVSSEGMKNERCSQSIVEILSASLSALGRVLGEAQLNSLRTAVDDSLRDDKNDDGILMQIERRLKDGDEIDRKVYDKLQILLASKVFRKDGGKIESGEINIVSFAGMNEEARKMTIEILLASIMRKRREDSDATEGLTIVIDEFQHLSLKKGLSLHQILTEGRKYGLNLILATQFVAGFDREQKAVINQAAVQVYFKQADSEARNVARNISAAKREYWEMKLKELKIGEAVAVGSFCVGDRQVQTPIVIHSECRL